MILEKASNIQLIRAFGSLTVQKVVQTNPPALAKLKTIHGIEKTEAVIAVILSDLSASFDGTLDKESVEEIAVELTSSKLQNLSMEEVFIACRNLKNADNNFSKLTVNKVLATMNKQLKERVTAFGLHNQNKHLSTKLSDPNRDNGMTETKEKFKQAQLLYLQSNPPQKPDPV